MRVMGLTGPSGSGKSSLMKCLEKEGAYCIDCDKIVKNLQKPGQLCYCQIVDVFGDEILSKDSAELDRKKLASIVFSDHSALVKLNAITHYHVIAHVREILSSLEQEAVSLVVIEAGALFESGLDTICDKFLYFIAPTDFLVQRIMERDRLTEEAARMRLSAQYSQKEAVSRSQLVLINDRSLSLLSFFSSLLLKKANEWDMNKEK